jgi:hypothetical protein
MACPFCEPALRDKSHAHFAVTKLEHILLVDDQLRTQNSTQASDNAMSNKTASRVRFAADDSPPSKKQKTSEPIKEDDIPSEHDTVEARRQRRLAREGLRIEQYEQDDDDDVYDNDENDDSGSENNNGGNVARKNHKSHDRSTSLAADGIEIEPFHMRQEESDGTGYFDGDTYVFRKRDPNEEADAWLESLDPGETFVAAATSSNDNAESQANSIDSLSDTALYGKILPWVSDSETLL